MQTRSSSGPDGCECLFCQIANGELPSEVVYDDGDVVAFRDIAPQAPVHVLVIPRKHVACVDDLRDEPDLAARLLLAAAHVARMQGLGRDGYRLVINNGRHGAQTVGHLHVHVIGARQLSGMLG